MSSRTWMREVENHAGSGLELAGRVGYGAKGIVYLIIGVLTTMAAVGSGEAKGSKDAVRSLYEQPFGRVLVFVVAVGLVSYTIWHFVEAFLDREGAGKDAKGVIRRITLVVSGCIYAGLAYYAAKLALASRDDSDDGGAEHWTAELLALPFGVWLVTIVGGIVIAFGLWQFHHASKAKFMKKYAQSRMSAGARRIAKAIGRFGLSARGFVMCIIGAFFIGAARSTDPDDAKGLPEALEVLASQPFGTVLLLVVAIGLAAYGLYCLSFAWYRDFAS